MRLASLILALCAAAACSDASTAPPSGTPNTTCSAPATLRAGEERTIAGAADIGCITLGAAASAEEYVLVAANVKPEAGSVWDYSISSGASGGSLASRAPSAPAMAYSTTGGSGSNDDWPSLIEDRVRAQEQQRLAGRSPATLRAEAQRLRSRASASRSSAPLPTVGDTMTFRVGNPLSADACSNYSDVQATVKAIGTRAVVLQDDAAPAGGYTDEDFRAFADEFDTLIYPVDVRWFGAVPDVNSDSHVTILFTPAINRLSPPGVGGFVGGFFFLSDLLPRSIPSQQWQCDASNEQEILYVLTPDPNGTINQNRHTVPSAREAARGVIAHELQHMINHGMRQANANPAPAETTWLNEGLSHLAEELVGRASRGYADSRRLTWNDILFELDDFDSFFRQNLLRLRSWMAQPDQASPISQSTATLAPRGAAWALLRYAIDRYSPNDGPAFTRALVAGPEIGVQNLEARTRAPLSEILPGFLLANVSRDATSDSDPRYRYAAWDMRDVMLNLNGQLDPLLVTPIGATISGRALAGSGSFFALSRAASAPATSYRVRTPTGGAVNFEDARVLLLRVK